MKLMKYISFWALTAVYCVPNPRTTFDSHTALGTVFQLLPFFVPQIIPSDSKYLKTFSITETGSSAKILGTRAVLTVPYSANLRSLTSEFYHTGESAYIGSILQTSGAVSNDFSSNLTYRITARNSSSLNYIVQTFKGSAQTNDLLFFSLQKTVSSEIYTGMISGNIVTVYTPYGTDPGNLTANFSHNGKTVQVNGINQVAMKNPQNFTAPLIYSVYSEAGGKQDYAVSVSAGSLNSKEIKAFWLNSYSASITGSDITVLLPFGTDLSGLVANFIHTGVEIRAENKSIFNGNNSLNCMNTLKITVIARDGTSAEYRLRVGFMNESVKVGGLLSGLGTGNSVLLQNSSSDSLTLAQNGAFNFPTSISNGNSYSISVKTQPSSQTCTVLNGSGTAYSDIVNILIFCSPNMEPKNTYTDNNDGTIFDKSTGLVWMKCPISSVSGVPRTGTDCTGGALGNVYQFCSTQTNDCNGGINGMNLQPPPWNASTSSVWNACSNANSIPSGGFAGKTDWRVPGVNELESLVDLSGINPPSTGSKINGIYFPNTTNNHWTSYSYTSAANAWVVAFGTGNSTQLNKDGTYNLRCVRGP